MKSILVQLDEPTYKSLERVTRAASRNRAEFIREAIRTAVFEAECRKMRAAYTSRPDSEKDADDWSSAEDFKA